MWLCTCVTQTYRFGDAGATHALSMPDILRLRLQVNSVARLHAARERSCEHALWLCSVWSRPGQTATTMHGDSQEPLAASTLTAKVNICQLDLGTYQCEKLVSTKCQLDFMQPEKDRANMHCGYVQFGHGQPRQPLLLCRETHRTHWQH